MDRRRFVHLAGAFGAAVAADCARPSFAASDLAVGTQASVLSSGLRVRGGPGTDQPTVATLDAGSLVDLLAVSGDGGWWRIAADSAVGFVSADYLSPTGGQGTGGIFDVDLDLRYSRQLSPIWCDPADLEMWSDYRSGGNGGGSAQLQSAIWNWESSHNAGFSVDQWDCSPYALASAAQHWMPGGGFDHFLYDDALAGSRVLAWLLANPGIREPSIALIWRGLHYVLVRGVRAVGDPSLDPSGARLLGFYIADPDRDADFWLGQDRFVPIERWVNEMFTPVTYLTPHTGVPGDVWQNRMVAIQRSWTNGPTESGRHNATTGSYAGL